MTVPNLWDKTTEAPSAELNPLTNPVLEQNLGRWAKVYFSNPPAKREQAVSHLLEEIKRESGPDAAQPSRPYFARDPKFERAVCSACRHQNPPGHKFCSRCGQALNQAQSASTEHPDTTRTPAVFPPNSENELPWLRAQELRLPDDSDAPRKRGWKYLVGAAVIVLAGFAYVQWAPGSWTNVATTHAPQVSAPAPALPPQNSSPAQAKVPAEIIAPKSVAPESVAANSESVAPDSKEPQAQNPSAPAEARQRTVMPAGIQPVAKKSRLPAATISRQTLADQGSDAPDLRLAQRYLGGSMGVRDSSEAAKLLWKAVSKQNATAAVLLSDLYLRGDGVPRSCDQARLLLVAAAKRGSPLAAQQLRNLESRGCR
jgi:TPR repeat protein